MDIRQEHDFWLGVLVDHLDFIREALHPDDTTNMAKCQELKQEGSSLLAMIESGEITQSALTFANKVGDFKHDLLARKLTSAFIIRLDPTFINHMLNELDEYINILKEYLSESKISLKHELHYHKLWLPDGKGHLEMVKKNLDMIDKELREKIRDHQDKFHHLCDKTLELIGFLRAVEDFEELRKFNQDAFKETQKYLALITEISQLWDKNAIQGTLTPQMLDHIMREHNYYLSKLGQDT